MEEACFPGENGFVALEYVGKAPVIRTWRGGATGVFYRFGGEKRVGLVDSRDAIRFILQRVVGGAESIWRPVRDENSSAAGD